MKRNSAIWIALLTTVSIGLLIAITQPPKNLQKESSPEIENALELAINKIESLTGKDSSDFTIQEIQYSDNFGSRGFLFSPKGEDRLLVGSDIGVLVELSSGKVTVLMD